MSKVRVADYIANFFASQGVKHVFMVTGGGSMHLNDAFGRQKELQYVACHHEQACAMAADSYYRMSGRPALVNVTTGPGGTNAITGVYGAYVDSLAMFVVSGQVKRETIVCNTGLPLRQMGDQEVDIISMVRGITKYAELVQEPNDIRYHLEKAHHLALTGRPGPVWLDVPIDVQGAFVETENLKGFHPTETLGFTTDLDLLQSQVSHLLKKLSAAERPAIMVGAGVRISRSHEKFLKFIEKLGIPVTTCWNAHDALWNAHPLYAGRPGTVGDRSGNFAVQNSDFLLVLGSRLNIRQVSYNYQSFARHAYKVMVDIDPAEMQKPSLKIDFPVCADLNAFFEAALTHPYEGPTEKHRGYAQWCRERVVKYPTVLPEYWETKKGVNPYCFMDSLFKELKENDLIVTGDGTACVVSFQAANLKKGQRLYTNSGCASMGFDLPAAVGASLAEGNKEIICLAGDGSIQMNLQELATIKKYQLPIKIFVLNNLGYHSIRQTQRNFFPDNIVGCGEESGLWFPSFAKIAAAYELPYFKSENHADMDAAIKKMLGTSGAGLCEIVLDLEQAFAPKISSKRLPDGKMVSSPLEDMFPFLGEEELKKNMLVP